MVEIRVDKFAGGRVATAGVEAQRSVEVDDVVQTGWVPTLAITVYNRAIPAPGPLRLRFRVQVIHDGYADEICEAWDSEDRLVMQSTQVTALRIPADAKPMTDAR